MNEDTLFPLPDPTPPGLDVLRFRLAMAQEEYDRADTDETGQLQRTVAQARAQLQAEELRRYRSND